MGAPELRSLELWRAREAQKFENPKIVAEKGDSRTQLKLQSDWPVLAPYWPWWLGCCLPIGAGGVAGL